MGFNRWDAWSLLNRPTLVAVGLAPVVLGLVLLVMCFGSARRQGQRNLSTCMGHRLAATTERRPPCRRVG